MPEFDSFHRDLDFYIVNRVVRDTIIPVDTIITTDAIPLKDTIITAEPILLKDTLLVRDGSNSDSISVVVSSLNSYKDSITHPAPGTNIPTEDKTQITLKEVNVKDSLQSRAFIKSVDHKDTQMSGVDSAILLQSGNTPVSVNSPDKDFLKTSSLVSASVSEQDSAGNTLPHDFFIAGWYFFVLMGILLFVAWVKSNYGSILLKTYEASVNFGVTLRMFKDNSQLQKQLDNILYAVYFFSFGFYLQLIATRFNLSPFGLEGLELYLVCATFLVGIFIVRVALSGIFGFIFKQRILFREYRYNIFVFNKLLGIIIIPFLLFFTYTKGPIQTVIAWVSIAVIAAVLILRVYRGIEFSIKKGVFILYLFLYLCALELVPILVLFKWIQSVV